MNEQLLLIQAVCLLVSGACQLTVAGLFAWIIWKQRSAREAGKGGEDAT